VATWRVIHARHLWLSLVFNTSKPLTCKDWGIVPKKTAVAGDENDDEQPKKTSKAKKKDEAKGLEASLWEAADRLRSNMDAAEYKHVVLGLIFLKYVSDVFARRQAALAAAVDDPDSEYFMPNEAAKAAILESRDEYTAEGVFWVPEGHRWEDLRKAAKQTDIGARIDTAMDEIEKENPSLKGVLPKNYARRELTPATLGGLIDTFSREDLTAEEHEGLDVLGRVFEYMVSQFASAEGKLGGEFYTPRSVVKLMVDMLEPFNGRVYDPACGSGGMFVQASKFLKAHGGVGNDISVFGQEQNPTTWRLAKMNLALRGIEANLGPQWGDSFGNDLHPDLRADFVIANPPFNISQWGGENLRDDPRWAYGKPPAGNANYAWIQHMLHHLAPTGTMATVLANGSLSSKTSGEGDIRKALVEADLVECIVAMPGQLFYTTGIPVCLWFLTKDKTDRKVKSERNQRNRKGEVLFIDARNIGHMATRTVREFTDEDIAKIADTYHAWRGEPDLNPYEDIAGFCASTTLATIREHDFVLTPGRYVGAEEVEDDGEPLEEKIARLATEIREGFTARVELQDAVLAALDSLEVGSDD
jgi:type I restriction enzyme M protein